MCSIAARSHCRAYHHSTCPHASLPQAFKFERSSRQLRHAMLWQRLRCYLLVAGVAGVLIFFIAGYVGKRSRTVQSRASVAL